MKRKRIVLALLTVVLLIGLSLAGCSSGGSQKSSKEGATTKPTDSNFNKTGLPIVKKKLTLTIAGQYSPSNGSAKWNQKAVFQQLEKKTNIHVNWQLSPLSGWQQKKNLLLASGNLPDVLLDVSVSDVTKYGPQGEFIPLNGLINKYAPNLKKIFKNHPEIKKEMTAPDGHIYSLPLVNGTSGASVRLWINKKWLDRLGLSIPRTTGELKKVLEAFKNKDPNGNGKHDELPYLHLYNAQSPNFLNGICQAFGVTTDTVLVEGGKVVFPMAQPGYKKCINYYHSLYKEGLINQTFPTITWDQYLAKIASGNKPTVGLFYGYSPAADVQNAKYRSDYVPLPPLKGPNGKGLIPSSSPYVNQGAFVITSADKHPAATMRWADRVYNPKVSFNFVNGPNTVKKLANGKYKPVAPPGNVDSVHWQYKETPALYFIYNYNQKMGGKILQPAHSFHQKWMAYYNKYVKPSQKNVSYPPVMFTADESNKISGYQPEIAKYTTKMTAQWIVHGGVDQGWNEYLQKLKGMGLQNMLKVYQKAYDRYKSH